MEEKKASRSVWVFLRRRRAKPQGSCGPLEEENRRHADFKQRRINRCSGDGQKPKRKIQSDVREANNQPPQMTQ